MKVVKAGYELIKEQDITKKIERIARVCYKSEDKICEGSDMMMLEKLVQRKHMAMLEHGSLAYIVSPVVYHYVEDIMVNGMHTFRVGMRVQDLSNQIRMKYTTYETGAAGNKRYVVSGNLRAWFEFFEFIKRFELQSLPLAGLVYCVAEDSKGIIDFRESFELVLDEYYKSMVQRVVDFSVLSHVERMIHETFSVLFTVDRGVTHEFVRMREASFAQESTRFCNYSNGKYGSEITLIEPCFWEEGTIGRDAFDRIGGRVEAEYIELTKHQEIPAQQARALLPTATKADIVITSNLLHWRHMFNLRACDATGPAHPQMKEVMVPLCKEMQEKYEFAFGDLAVAE